MAEYCECNHVREEHEGEYGECLIDGCDCIMFDLREEDDEGYEYA
jgi:hypothetical protein